MFTLTSLNLNGIRSATSKGLEAWLEKAKPDCICVQEVKAQAPDVAGKFEVLAGLKGHFHFAQKKGYSGVGVYTREEPSDVIVGFDGGEFDFEGRYIELRFDTPQRKRSLISSYFPSGSSGPERQEAKYRFLAAIEPHLQALKVEREFVLCGDRRNPMGKAGYACIDFNQVRPHEGDAGRILSSILINDRYYPRPGSRHWEAFAGEYLAVADSLGAGELAREVLDGLQQPR